MNLNATSLTHPKYRPDIDGLRAMAILSVVGFHAFPDWIPGGFIGVDIFFVISGFLISTIIFENLDRGTFSFAEFYARRVKRIFPALMLVLVSCLAFGWFALLADEYRQLGKHVAAGAGFVANLMLWSESGYFDNAADSKPLLHLWSLGVEEQFYIVWPLMLWAAWRKRVGWLAVIMAGLAASFFLNIYSMREDAVAAFYAPHTRFWELLCGSLLAWYVLRRKAIAGISAPRPNELMSIAGIIVFALGMAFITKESAFPGWWAILPTSGAALVILAGSRTWINRVLLSNRAMVWIGLISYPLYLWHWPLLSFARIIDGKIPSRLQSLLLVLISIVLAWLTYRFLETPIRHGKNYKAKVLVLAGIALALVAAGVIVACNNGFDSRLKIEPRFLEAAFKEYPHFPLHNEKCDRRYPQFSEFSACLLSKDRAPEIAIIGDSHSQQYFKSASVLFKDRSVINIGQWSCLPFSSQAFQDAERCNDKIRLTLEFVKNEPSIKTIYLAGYFGYLMSGKKDPVPYVKKLGDKETDAFKSTAAEVLSALASTGKKIVVMEDIPDLTFDPKSCARVRFNMPDYIFNSRFGSQNLTPVKCEMDSASYEARIKPYDDILRSVLQNFPQVGFYKTRHLFCDSSSCKATKADTLLYYNGDHLTLEGADLVTKNMGNGL